MSEVLSATSLMRSVRDHHVSLILRTLLREPMARKELARRTGISTTTITHLTTALIQAGLVRELPAHAAAARTRGRPQVPLALKVDGRLVVGTQIRGGHVATSAYTLDGRQKATARVPHENRSPREVVAAAVSLTRGLVGEIGPDSVLGVGVSTGGAVDFESGTVLAAPQLGWRDVALREPFTAGLGVPVVVDSSVRSLAVSRLWADTAATDSMLVVFVAGIVASALVLDRSLYRGVDATAGEVAHFPVAGGPGVRCPCGAVDCLEVVASDRAVQRVAVERGLLPETSTWDDVYTSEGEAADGLARLRLERAARLGDAVGHLVEVINPASTIIAGRIGTADEVDRCLAGVRGRSARTRAAGRRLTQHWPVADPEWDLAAASLVLDDFFKRPTFYEPSLAS